MSVSLSLSNGFVAGFVATAMISAARFLQHDRPDLPGVRFTVPCLQRIGVTFVNEDTKRAWGSLCHYLYGSLHGVIPLIIIPAIIPITEVSLFIGGVLLWAGVGMSLLAASMMKLCDIGTADTPNNLIALLQARNYQGIFGKQNYQGVIDHLIWGGIWLITLLLIS